MKLKLLLTLITVTIFLQIAKSQVLLDPAFYANKPYTLLGNILTLKVQPDNKILIGGDGANYEGVAYGRILRLNENGTLDQTFQSLIGANDIVRGITLLGNGKIMVCGDFTEYNNVPVNRIVRLNNNGTIDPTFNVSGTFNGGVTKILEDPFTNGLYVTGFFSEFDSSPAGRVMKLNEDGSKNTQFNAGTGADGSIITIRRLSDGKIVLGGYFSNFNANAYAGIVKINSVGVVDNTFLSGVGVNADGGITDIYAYPDDKLLIGGNFNTFNHINLNNLAKLNSDGSVNTDFDIGSGLAGGGINAIDVQDDGKILLGAFVPKFYDGNACSSILRINANGSFDSSFNTGKGCSIVYTVMSLDNNTLLMGGNFLALDITNCSSVAKVIAIRTLSLVDQSLKATSEIEGNLIKWNTDGTENGYFEIVKSDDGKKWSHLWKLETAKINTRYQYLDRNPFLLSYYRIRLYTLDGKFTESEIVSVKNKMSTKIPLFFPNPAKNKINVRSDISKVQIFDLMGRKLLEKKVESDQSISLKGLIDGSYLINLFTEDKNFSERLIIKE